MDVITKVNEHVHKESGYRTVRTVSGAETRFLKREVGPEERPTWQHQLWARALFLCKEDVSPEPLGLKSGGAVVAS